MRGYRKAWIFVSGVSLIAVATQASAQDVGGDSATANQSTETSESNSDSNSAPIIVTGSRIAQNGNEAPTPVTVAPTERLLETAPSSISDALQRLPQFSAQPTTRNIGSAQGNSTANTLDLRHFGSNRNLILLDGNRLPPASTSGAVDTNVIPQSLIQRVEVVTGGASAVYGSDAVTGVVNFIVDKNFNGVKFNSQFGTSTYGDDDSWRVGVAVGTPIFDHRGHIEASFDHYNSNGLIGLDSRPYGADTWIVGGNGSKDNPYRLVKNGRTLLGSRGGMIVGDAPPELQDIVFNTNGVPTPFIHGSSAGVNGIESGGDGGYYDAGTLVAPLRTNQVFARFDYDLTNDISFYLQGSHSNAKAVYPYASARNRSQILSGNPFIPASIQQIMTDTNTDAIEIGRLQSREDGLIGRVNDASVKNTFIMAGFKGTIFENFKWDANYIYSVNSNTVINHGNVRTNKFAAALDAVVDPSTGRVVCQVSLTQYADLYQGCEPLNVFGPTAPSRSAYDWLTEDTSLRLRNRMHDVNFSVTGSPFSLWAGPVQLALSAEYRWLSLSNDSSVDGTAKADCTGLRPTANCTADSTAWQHDVSVSNAAKQNVKEVAGEAQIPLLHNVPLIKSLDLNLAARLTDYSTSGSATTWKIGGSWEVVPSLRFRATRSRDIRAPTLTDLFAPNSISVSGYTDLHTNISAPVIIYRSGNPDLTPEVAYTTTVGLVFEPAFLPRFTLAVDYYNIRINNAIVGASGFSANVQQECEDSNGTSPLCDLAERPLPFSDRSPANFPTRVLQRNVNASREWTKGVDVEANYSFDTVGIASGAEGRVDLRALVSYQPTLARQTLPGLPVQQSAGIVGNPTGLPGISKVRAVFNAGYSSGGLKLRVTERWQSKQQPSDRHVFYDLRPDIPAYSYTDVYVSYDIKAGGVEFTPFLTVENLFNKQPPLIGGQNNVPGLFYSTGRGFDVIGRYFTMGIRGRF